MGREARARSLRTRLLVTVGLGALALIALLGWAGSAAIARLVAGQAESRLVDAGHRSVALVDRVIADRRREVAIVASHPAVVSLLRAPSAEGSRALIGLAQFLDAVDLTVVRPDGSVAGSAGSTTTLLRGGARWWEQPIREGTTTATAQLDSAGGRVLLTLASAVRDPAGNRPIGALRTVFTLAPVQDAFSRASLGSGVRVDVIDATGHVLVSSGGDARFNTLPGYEVLAASSGDSIFSYSDSAGPRRATMFFTNSGQWRLLSHTDQRTLDAPARAARQLLLIGGLVVAVLLAFALWLVGRYMARRVSRPATELAGIAEAVAGGDLSVSVGEGRTNDEIGRLRRATEAMIVELRRLATAMRSSAQETAAMSSEITAGSEEMSASAQEMARTSNELSGQAASMARVIRDAAGDAGRLMEISGRLTAGARDGVQRNIALRALAHDSRARLDASIEALQTLAGEVQTSATAVEALAVASEEIRAFVTLVHKVARQSKLLALNAAMEAARAGDHGQGFAVVATEVRRLAANSTEAAGRTEVLVRDIVARIEQSRGASARTVGTVQTVLEAPRHGIESFGEIEQAVQNAEQWTADTEREAVQAGELVGGVTRRLEDLAKGTEQFAAAMEQVAASSEEQSASTQEIAAASQALATAAERLARLVSTFKLGDELASTELHKMRSSLALPARRTKELVG